jgi:WD40 repeat protein
MTNIGYSGSRFQSRLSGLGGCLLVLAGVGTIIGFVAPARDDPEEPKVGKEGPFAQAVCEAHGSPIGSLAFSPDDARLASATVSGEVWLGDLRGGRWGLIRRGPMGSAQSLAFSPDGRALAVAGLGPIVRLLDAESGEEREPLALDPGKNAMHVAFSRDGKHIASGGFGGELTLWEWPNRRRLASMSIRRGGTTSLAFSPDGSTLASGTSAGMVGLWDVNSREERTTFRAHEPGDGVTAVAFSPDGTRLVTASYMGRTVRRWTSDGEIRATLPRVDSGVRALAFSPDGALLAMARGDGIASLWSLTEARAFGSVQANETSLQAIAFSSDGRVLATGGTDGCVRLWDVEQALSGTQR